MRKSKHWLIRLKSKLCSKERSQGIKYFIKWNKIFYEMETRENYHNKNLNGVYSKEIKKHDVKYIIATCSYDWLGL